MNPRRLLLEFYDAALRAVDGRACVFRALQNLDMPGVIAAFAIGKAASAMLSGARDALGERLASALLITKHGHVDPSVSGIKDLRIIESAHPVPDATSLLAGDTLVAALQALPATRFPLFLISGGSSSLVECPVQGVSLSELRDLNQRGLGAGWNITRLNAERSKLSRLKGGGVARWLGSRPAIALFVSDVLTDDPNVIGSGLLGESGAHGHRDQIRRVIVSGIDDAVRAISEAALAHGKHIDILDGHIDGDVNDVAEQFLASLRSCEGDGVVWGGESTVRLPPQPGRGGRNQHLALVAARALRAGEGITLLAAGTDGTDGLTDDAGAIVDSGTVSRAELAGVDVDRALRHFDSGLALEAAEDLVHTGPTGTNVGDVLIGIKQPVRVL